jgi:hypothetical protein
MIASEDHLRVAQILGRDGARTIHFSAIGLPPGARLIEDQGSGRAGATRGILTRITRITRMGKAKAILLFLSDFRNPKSTSSIRAIRAIRVIRGSIFDPRFDFSQRRLQTCVVTK